MHIPDGYLGPKTCVAFYVVMAPFWYAASRRAQSTLKLKQLPLLALGAAFTFVIMMLNIPVPGGTSGHMVGTVVVAIALGPWAGVVAMSLTVALQAFLFGDGGITTLAANAFNMAVVMSFAGYYVYRVISAGPAPSKARRLVASAAAAYVGVNLAALAVAVELGVQPIIAADAAGAPLYAPYPLSVTMPAMMFSHLAIFGPIEAVGTALVISYAHGIGEGAMLEAETHRSWKPLVIGLASLVVLVPLGLFAVGTPWGEWSVEQMRSMLGYVPSGMRNLGDLWRGVLPDYGSEAGGLRGAALYAASAAVGSAVIVGIVYLWGRIWKRE